MLLYFQMCLMALNGDGRSPVSEFYSDLLVSEAGSVSKGAL
jgi:hypothetical protein